MFNICYYHHMSTKPATQIGMREFMRTMRQVKTAVSNGEEFEVLDHATPVFRVVPVQSEKTKKYTFAELEQLQFVSNAEILASDVDRQVYD